MQSIIPALKDRESPVEEVGLKKKNELNNPLCLNDVNLWYKVIMYRV